jgi:hypothetical protein
MSPLLRRHRNTGSQVQHTFTECIVFEATFPSKRAMPIFTRSSVVIQSWQLHMPPRVQGLNSKTRIYSTPGLVDREKMALRTLWNFVNPKKYQIHEDLRILTLLSDCDILLPSAQNWYPKCIDLFWSGYVNACLDNKIWTHQTLRVRQMFQIQKVQIPGDLRILAVL